MTKENAAALKSWQHDRFGLFIHWGLYALPARHEWVGTTKRSPMRSMTISTSGASTRTSTIRTVWARGRRRGRHEVFRHHHQAPRGLLPVGFQADRLQGHPTPRAGRDLLRPMVEAFRATEHARWASTIR